LEGTLLRVKGIKNCFGWAGILLISSQSIPILRHSMAGVLHETARQTTSIEWRKSCR
jgi:hypothetical protein